MFISFTLGAAINGGELRETLSQQADIQGMMMESTIHFIVSNCAFLPDGVSTVLVH